jgi:pimeloyl-ACP methyl ester carboxylesterase
MRPQKLLIACVALLTAAAANAAKPAIVLVHGAFANASGWSRVIAILQRDGYVAVGVEEPLQSLQGDIAATRRALEGVAGPVVLVGHSYGGVVIGGAAAGNDRVKALVFVAAIAPEPGERVNRFFAKYPPQSSNALKQDSAGFLTIDRDRFGELFASDLPAAERALLAATQKPMRAGNFAAVLTDAAWKTIPSWYVVAKSDRALNPDLERFYAKRMGARTTEIDASHFVFLSHPREIARVIEEAAAAVGK